MLYFVRKLYVYRVRAQMLSYSFFIAVADVVDRKQTYSGIDGATLFAHKLGRFAFCSFNIQSQMRELHFFFLFFIFIFFSLASMDFCKHIYFLLARNDIRFAARKLIQYPTHE